MARRAMDAQDASSEDIPIGPDVALLHTGPIVAEQYARIFVAQHGENLRFVEPFGTWLVWDEPDGVWRPDNARAMEVVGDFCLAASNCREKKGEREKLGSFAFVFGLERRLRSKLAATVAEWDANPMILNTPGPWTIDLETGERRESCREDRCTKSTAVGVMGVCPLWCRFLDDVCAGSADRIAYLQRVAGYACTGSTAEQCLFFLFGTGQNGKGVFVRTLAWVLKDYAAASAIETFTAGMTRHLEELAVLRGARLVHTSETDRDKTWNEARLKQVTGGDYIRANYMRQNSFEFLAAFKLFVSGNHKPALNSVDKAVKRRFNLIPFDVEIPDDRRDPELEDRLKLEGPGILAWIVEGCVQWQLKGLAPPADVRAATETYIGDEDLVGQWLQDCCELGPNGYTKTATLFSDPVCGWRQYAEKRGEHPGQLRNLSNELVKRKFRNFRRGFKGLELRSVERAQGGLGFAEDAD